ncbi:MAG: archaea-specific SMC-related protein [Halanaeroarchaeum sp.]
MSQAGTDRADAVSASSSTDVSVSVQNVGGIETADITIEPGCTILTGENATNRTSVLRALGGVLGGSSATVKSDAQSGSVSLTIDWETYERTYSRNGETVVPEGTPYTRSETIVDLFVTVLNDNPIRQAVERADDLHDVLMQPIDTEEIEHTLEEKRTERDRLDDRIERVADRREDLPALEERRSSLNADIEAIDDELASLRSSLDELEERTTQSGEDDLIQTLESRQQALAEKEHQRDAVDAEIDRLEAEIEELTPIESPETDLARELERVEETLRTQRDSVQSIEDEIHSLTTIVSFNEDLLSGDDTPLPGSGGEVTARLGPDETQSIECWTCGSTVERQAIEDRLDDLRSIVSDKRSRRDDVTAQVRELERRHRELEQRIEDRRSRRETLSRLEAEAADARDRRERLSDDIETLRSEIDQLQRTAEHDEVADSAALERFEAINDLEYERGQLEQQLADVTTEIESIESLPEVESLRAERAAVADEIDRLRNRIATVEDEVVESFNEHMDEVLEILDYENIARVWLEKKTRGADGDRSVSFDLHIVRETGGGRVYDDRVDHLSESEREVIGLLAALAGYLAHDVYEEVPFILLDSLEAIDNDRLSKLIEYFDEYVPYRRLRRATV